ncbi:MAG: alpha/beta hydrolase [Planctomycetota bacterium]|nr:alpha/beta hydrolase [Planctomycetota bacterium]
MSLGGLRVAAAAVAGLTLLVTGVGCRTRNRDYATEQRLEAGLVVSLDGVGGYNWGPRWLRSGLDEAGVKSAIIIYDWSRGPSGLWVGDLMARERNQAAANDLATRVATYASAMPHRPVTLIGHSGGAAVVVWALEAMQPPAPPGDPHAVRGAIVERAILLAPALSPDYDLTKALRAVRSRLYVMYSNADVGLLGAGTAVFGTMDGQHSVSAGLVGFKLTPEVDAGEYAKVRQVPWSLDFVKMGHLGGHMGWTTTRFARDFLAPILAGKSDPGQPLVE